jgi:site-specific DNA-methyltransferase (adenine-specific)
VHAAPHLSATHPVLAFETVHGRLYQGDAVAWLQSLPAGSVDLVVADPPYGGNAVHWDKFASLDEYAQWCDAWIAECHRVLKPSGTCFICGWSENLAYLKVLGDKYFAACRWLVWFYRNKQAAWRTDWGRAHESILHFRKAKRFAFNQDDVRVPYNAHTQRYPQHTQATSSVFGSKNGGKSGHVWQPHPLGAKPKDVFEISTLNNGMAESTTHPTQKPEELIRRLVQACTDRGDLVIDPFGGSGTTFAVCEKLERRWAGTELESEYVAVARARLESIDPDEQKHAQAYRQGLDASLNNRESVRTGSRITDPKAPSRPDDQVELLGLEDLRPEIVEQ